MMRHTTVVQVCHPPAFFLTLTVSHPPHNNHNSNNHTAATMSPHTSNDEICSQRTGTSPSRASFFLSFSLPTSLPHPTLSNEHTVTVTMTTPCQAWRGCL